MKNLNRRLQEYLDSHEKFDWATNNCCQFPSGWVRLCEGFDPFDGIETVDGPIQSARVIKSLGGLPNAITSRLARDPIPVAELQTGDVVLTKLQSGQHIAGIVCGIRSVFLTESSPLYVSTLNCELGWRIKK